VEEHLSGRASLRKESLENRKEDFKSEVLKNRRKTLEERF
jgi:hypothetical protein